MTTKPPGFNRTYTPQEWAAARRVGITEGTSKKPGGIPVYAGGPYWPAHAAQMAADWALVSKALDREWKADS